MVSRDFLVTIFLDVRIGALFAVVVRLNDCVYLDFLELISKSANKFALLSRARLLF
jgi:hypothetical protein